MAATPYQSLTAFLPAGPPAATLVFFHGGGWASGYKEWMHLMAPALIAAGVAFVSAGHCLAPAHWCPACYEDCQDAVAWASAWSERIGAGPRVFVGGHSAGGHLAALLAVRRHRAGWHGLPADLIAGCLPVSGVYEFGEGSGLAARPRFLESDSAATEASPLQWVDGPAAPFLLGAGPTSRI